MRSCRDRRPLREDFLELVDHQQQFALVVGQDAPDRAQQTALVLLQLLQQAARRIDRNAQQGDFKFFKRVISRHHLSDKPLV